MVIIAVIELLILIAIVTVILIVICNSKYLESVIELNMFMIKIIKNSFNN